MARSLATAATTLTRRHLLTLAVVAAGGSGLLAACGGSAVATTTATSAAASSAAAASAAPASTASTTATLASSAAPTSSAATVAATTSSRASTAAATASSSPALSTAATSSAAASAPAAGKTTLIFEWPQYTDEKTRYGQYIIDTYQKLHPTITVEPMFNTNPTEKLTATIAAGSPPDVGWFGAGWPQFIQAFLPLDTFVQQTKVDPSKYFAKLWDACHWQDKLYTMPNGFTCTLMYYNRDLLKNVGAAAPTDTSTWDDLITAATKTLKPESNVYGMALDLGSYYAELYYGGAFWNAAATKATIDNPVAIDLLQLYKDVDTKYRLVPPASVVKANGATTEDMFFKGMLTFFAGGAWALEPVRTAAKFDWDIVPLPVRSVSGQNYQSTGMWTEEFFIIKDTKHQAASWDFLQWVTGPDLVTWATKEGHIVPGRTDVANSPTFLQAFPQPKNIAAFLKAAEVAVPTLVHPESAKLGKVIGDSVGLFLADPQKASAAEALQQANSQIQNVLDATNSGKKA